jgi:hypothetical protein
LRSRRLELRNGDTGFDGDRRREIFNALGVSGSAE